MAYRINEKLYLTSLGTAYSKPVGSYDLVPIPTLGLGRVHKVYIKQASGTNVGGAIHLLSRNVTNFELFRILPSQTLTAGQKVEVFSEHGYAFKSDDTDQNIYLVIDAATAGTSTWDIQIVWATTDS